MNTANTGHAVVPAHSGRFGSLAADDRYQGYAFEPETDEGPKLDFRVIYAILRRNALLIGGVISLAAITGLTATLLMTPRYVATASVQVDQEADRVLSSQDVQPAAAYQDADRFLQTQVDVLKSRAMTIRVAQSLNLVGSPKLFETMHSKMPEPKIGLDRRQQLKDATVSLISDNLGVSLPRESRVVSISFKSPDQRFSALVANAYATEFISSNLQRKYDSSTYARDFLSKQLGEAKTRLEISERDLNNYARSAGLIKTSEPGANGTSVGPRSITTASLVQLNEAANEARSARTAAEQKWRSAAGTPLMNITDVLANPAIQTLLQRQAEASAALSQERERHRDTYPTVIQLQAQVEQLSQQIRTLATNIRSSIRDQYQVAMKLEQSLDTDVRALKGDTLAEQDRSVRYNILAREADTNRTLYDGLLQRFKEVSAAAGITSNNVSVIDQADPPSKPSSPKLFLNLAFSLLAGLAAAAALVFIREQMDDAVRVPEDIDRKLGLTVLGAIPLVKAGEDVLELLQSPRSAISEAYHGLRTSLLYSSIEGLPRNLLVTSSQSGEGKSTTSFAIAADLAKLDKRVVLVDVDLRRPSLHRVLGTRNGIGLSSLLTRQARVDQAIQATSIANLMFIASGPIPPSPTELLGSPSMRELLEKLGEEFDVVVLDGPPVLGLADAPILSALVEGTIFVVESSRGHRGATKAAVRRLQSAHSHLLGGVLTKFDPRKAGNNQYYGYDYYYYGISDDHDGKAKITVA
ncbi:MAG: polysaccharide biosynthesis tyrosine autokinase [Sphingomonas sp.]|uniref:GumC family protein n=1 Tax=Sphingomonas sp. TaxID=28214 RepID=UPI00356A2A7E